MEPKERILSKANELFHRYGIRSVSMDDIAAQLGMSKKTLYQYFVDKDELVTAVLEITLAENRDQCMVCNQKGEDVIHEIFLSLDMLKEMLSNMNPALMFDLQKYHHNAYSKFLDFRNNFLYKVIRENLEKGKAEGLYREDIDTEILTRYRLHTLMISFDSDVFPSNRTNLIYIEEQLLEHFLYGLATAKGQKLIQKYKTQRKKQNT